MFWTLHYLLNYDETSVHEILSQIPTLVPRLTYELEYEGDRLQQSPVNRPILRIIGNLLTLNSVGQTSIANELMTDEKFQTFLLQVLFQKASFESSEIIYQKESLWLLSNILGCDSEQNFEIILENKSLIEKISELAHLSPDFQVRREALVCLYNLCENFNSKYLGKVMQKGNPSSAFFDVISNYMAYDPYTVMVAISFCSLICEKYGSEAV